MALAVPSRGAIDAALAAEGDRQILGKNHFLKRAVDALVMKITAIA